MIKKALTIKTQNKVDTEGKNYLMRIRCWSDDTHLSELLALVQVRRGLLPSMNAGKLLLRRLTAP